MMMKSCSPLSVEMNIRPAAGSNPRPVGSVVYEVVTPVSEAPLARVRSHTFTPW